MKNLKKKFRFRIHLKSKHLLVIMTFFCGSAVVATLASGITSAPLQEAAGMIVVPFEKSITTIGLWLTDINKSFQEKQDLIDQNEELKNTVDTLTEQNNILIQNQSELSRLQELYDLDAEYSDYPKVAARIISKDPGNWYDTFMINKGSKDGIRVDNNVIAGKGLVGIVTEVGSNWATVRAIIDDSSTSNISEKYVEGLFIGYVSDIQLDTNNLTKSGTIVTPVDFQHLKDVFVITVNKKDSTEEGAEE